MQMVAIKRPRHYVTRKILQTTLFFLDLTILITEFKDG